MAFNPFAIGFTNSFLQGVKGFYDEELKNSDEEYKYQQSVLAAMIKSENPDVVAAAITGLQNPKSLTLFGKLKENPGFTEISDITKRLQALKDQTDKGVPPQTAAQMVGLPQSIQHAYDSGALPQADPATMAVIKNMAIPPGTGVQPSQIGAGMNPIASIQANPTGTPSMQPQANIAFLPTPFEKYASTQTGVTPTANQVPVPSAGMSTNVPSQGGGDQGGQINPAPAAATAPPPAIATPAQTTPTPATAPPTGAPAATATVGAPALGAAAPAAPGEPPPPTSFKDIRARAEGALYTQTQAYHRQDLWGKIGPEHQFILNELARTAATAREFEDQPLTPQTYQQFMNTLHPEAARITTPEQRTDQQLRILAAKHGYTLDEIKAKTPEQLKLIEARGELSMKEIQLRGQQVADRQLASEGKPKFQVTQAPDGSIYATTLKYNPNTGIYDIQGQTRMGHKPLGAAENQVLEAANNGETYVNMLLGIKKQLQDAGIDLSLPSAKLKAAMYREGLDPGRLDSARMQLAGALGANVVAGLGRGTRLKAIADLYLSHLQNLGDVGSLFWDKLDTLGDIIQTTKHSVLDVAGITEEGLHSTGAGGPPSIQGGGGGGNVAPEGTIVNTPQGQQIKRNGQWVPYP